MISKCSDLMLLSISNVLSVEPSLIATKVVLGMFSDNR